MLNYEKLFESFTRDGCTLELMIKWVQKGTGASDIIVAQALAETMAMVAKGKLTPARGKANEIHTGINNFMFTTASDLVMQSEHATTRIIEHRQRILVEEQLKQLSDFDREYEKMTNGTWWRKVLKFFFLPYEGWTNEEKREVIGDTNGS